jgi:hypothetical protein
MMEKVFNQATETASFVKEQQKTKRAAKMVPVAPSRATKAIVPHESNQF